MRVMKKYILLLLILPFALGACDFLDDYSQDAVHPRTWTDFDELLIGQGYMKVAPGNTLGFFEGYFPYLNFMADEVEEQDRSGSSSGFPATYMESVFGYYTWQQRVGANDKGTGFFREDGDWRKLYEHINIVNSIIVLAPDMPQDNRRNIEGTAKVLGEAHFLRAAYYFLLANLYAKPYDPATAAQTPGLPIKTTEYIEDKVYGRDPLSDVYALITEDLLAAEKYFEGLDEPVSIYRAGLTATNLLQSRVYLYMQDWANARDYAAKALAHNNRLLDLNTYGGALLTKGSPEIIFSMGGNCLPLNFSYTLDGVRVSYDLYDAYDEQDDIRRERYIYKDNDFLAYGKMAANPSARDQSYDQLYYWYYNGKRAEISDNFAMRTAEAYLNHAEACAYLGEEATARTSLDNLRRTRFVTGSDYRVGLSGEALVKEIREERRRELALEGHRWFDLRRYQVCEKYPESRPIKRVDYIYTQNSPYTLIEKREYTLEAFDAAYTLNIPQEVIEFNTGMENNPRPVRNFEILPL